MKTIPISKFKATCLAVLEEVRRTGREVVVTKRGEPIAKIVIAGRPEPRRSGFGAMKDRVVFVGDIVSPAVPEEDWTMFKDDPWPTEEP